MKNLIFLQILFLYFIGNATGLLNPYSGMDGMPLLQIPIDGVCNCAGVNDLSSLSINPAGISQIKNYQLKLIFFDWFSDTSIQSIAWGQSLDKSKNFRDKLINLSKSDNFKSFIRELWTGKIATRIVWLYVPPIINYDITGYEDGIVRFNSMIFSFTYAKSFNQLNIGGQINYAFQGIKKNYYHLISLDLGWQFEKSEIILPLLEHKRWIISPLIGGSIKNITLPIQKNKYCLVLQNGIKIPLSQFLYASLDTQKELYNLMSFFNLDWKIIFGMEYEFKNILFTRGVFKIGEDLNFFNIEIGVRFQFRNNYDLKIKYICFPYNKLGPLNNNFSTDLKIKDLIKF